jgi:cytidylate kinase
VGREGRRYREVLEETRTRERSEARRFKRFYDIDINDYSSFDLVLNTDRLSVNSMARILEAAVASTMRRRS